jgi:hypothetical protein
MSLSVDAPLGRFLTCVLLLLLPFGCFFVFGVSLQGLDGEASLLPPLLLPFPPWADLPGAAEGEEGGPRGLLLPPLRVLPSFFDLPPSSLPERTRSLPGKSPGALRQSGVPAGQVRLAAQTQKKAEKTQEQTSPTQDTELCQLSLSCMYCGSFQSHRQNGQLYRTTSGFGIYSQM